MVVISEGSHVALGLTMKEVFLAEGSAFVLMSEVCFDP